MKQYHKSVRIWLAAGVCMVAIQILLGGITRLTGSGLSITRWEIVTGTIPPLDQQGWKEAFELYKATPQYQKINRGMALHEFKYIYYWEYLHRLWARLMGLVFIIPFGIFWYKGMIDKRLLKQLFLVVSLAAVVAMFGWIMVVSGLRDRPWVDAYKLTIHLNLGLLLFAVLLWVLLKAIFKGAELSGVPGPVRQWGKMLIILLIIQLLLGGLMSGMKACIYYPTWPEMNGEWVPYVLLSENHWRFESFIHYDEINLVPALVQFLHRAIGYIIALVALAGYVLLRGRTRPVLVRRISELVAGVVIFQIVSGILTVVNCAGFIPLWLGVAHQFGAILLLTALVTLRYLTTR